MQCSVRQQPRPPDEIRPLSNIRLNASHFHLHCPLCLNRNGNSNHWIDIPNLAGHNDALIVNAGDLILRWTNYYWTSNVHRVLGYDSEVAAPGGQNAMSIVFSQVHMKTPESSDEPDESCFHLCFCVVHHVGFSQSHRLVRQRTGLRCRYSGQLDMAGRLPSTGALIPMLQG